MKTVTVTLPQAYQWNRTTTFTLTILSETHFRINGETMNVHAIALEAEAAFPAALIHRKNQYLTIVSGFLRLMAHPDERGAQLKQSAEAFMQGLIHLKRQGRCQTAPCSGPLGKGGPPLTAPMLEAEDQQHYRDLLTRYYIHRQS